MNKPGIRIQFPGLLTTIQDDGRIGYQEFGISASGAMDLRAMRLANILVRNNKDEAVLEMTLMGAVMTFTGSNTIAITGADQGAIIDGIKVPLYTAVAVHAGDTLIFGSAATGCRTYLAFAGGLVVSEILGSKSTNLKCGIGGLQGRQLKEGDELEFVNPVDEAPDPKRNLRDTPLSRYPDSNSQRILRIIPGPQAEYVTEKGMDTFLSSVYTVTPRSDRMGCNFDGPVIETRDKTDIISDGIPFGAVQIPSGGKPIVMMADRQTTGGYAKIGTVISVDLPILAQCKPGDTVRFRQISMNKAQRLHRKEQKQYAAIERKFTPLK